MNNIVAAYRKVIIKSVSDAEKFLSGFTSSVRYIPCGDIDICVEDLNGEKQVSWRWISERGRAYAPYTVVNDGARFLYHHRKYVNDWQRRH